MNQFPQNTAPQAQASSGFGGTTRDEGAVWLTPGIHTVAITKVEWVVPQTNKPYVGVTMMTQDDKSTLQRFYMSPAAQDISMQNMVHLFNKVTTDAELNKLAWADGDFAGMCAAIAPLVVGVGVAIEIKLSGEEYEGKINAKFAFRPFAQKPGDDSLIFNPDVDVKRDDAPDMTSNLAAPSALGAIPAATPGVPVAPGAVAPGIQIPGGPQ